MAVATRGAVLSNSSTGILAYGYDLGNDDGWKLQDLGEYGELPHLPWIDRDEYDNGDYDFAESAMVHLIATVARFTEEWDRGDSDGYFQRERDARYSLGVEFITYGHYDYARHILAAAKWEASEWDAIEVDPNEFRAKVEWANDLHRAVKALGIKPTQAKPTWILTSSYG